MTKPTKDLNINAIKKLCQDKPVCLRDPCINKICSNNNIINCNIDSDCPSGGTCISDSSYYDPVTGQCVPKTPGYYNEPNAYSLVGYSCKNPCSENPCGNRGTCVIDNNVQKCTNCQSPYSNDDDATNQCMTIKKVKQADCADNNECWSKKCAPIGIKLNWLNIPKNVCF